MRLVSSGDGRTMPKIGRPRGTKPPGGKAGFRKRASAVVIKLATKRSPPDPKTRQETMGTKVELSVDVEHLLPKLDDE
jgi:hypothetical protein